MALAAFSKEIVETGGRRERRGGLGLGKSCQHPALTRCATPIPDVVIALDPYFLEVVAKK